MDVRKFLEVSITSSRTSWICPLADHAFAPYVELNRRRTRRERMALGAWLGILGDLTRRQRQESELPDHHVLRDAPQIDHKRAKQLHNSSCMHIRMRDEVTSICEGSHRALQPDEATDASRSDHSCR